MKILIADDERITREGLQESLDWRSLGFNVVDLAEDGYQALSMMSDTPYDVLLCDVRMPRMNGTELAAAVRERNPDLPIVFLSGYTDKDYLKTAIRIHAIDYVEKPVDLVELELAIKKASAVAAKRGIAADRRIDEPFYTHGKSVNERTASFLIDPAGHPSHIRSLLESAGVHFPAHDSYMTALCHFSPETEISNTAIPHGEIVAAVAAHLSEIRGRFITGCIDEQLAIHFRTADIGTDGIKLLCLGLLHKLLHGHPQFRCTIGLGKPVRGIHNLRNSYDTALSSIGKEFFYGRNQVIEYRPGCGATYRFDPELPASFNRKLAEGQYAECIGLIERLAAEIKLYPDTDPNEVRHYFLHLMIQLSPALERHSISLEEQQEERQFFWQSLLQKKTMVELREYLVQYLHALVKHQKGKEGVHGLVHEAIQYIYKNYHEDITLQAIAAHVHLTPTYLSGLFKKVTCKTMNQFITDVRINKSMELLRDNRLKLYEIADRVGFANENYYSNVFKKLTGCKPSEYREKLP